MAFWFAAFICGRGRGNFTAVYFHRHVSRTLPCHDREYTAGVSRLFKIDDANSLEATPTIFKTLAASARFASNGAVGSMVYRRKLSDKGNFLAELGMKPWPWLCHAGLV